MVVSMSWTQMAMFLCLFLFSFAVSTSVVEIYYSKETLFYASSDIKRDTVSVSALKELALESAGLPFTMEEPDVVMPFTADIFEHVKAYLIVIINGFSARPLKWFGEHSVSYMVEEKSTSMEVMVNDLLATFPRAYCSENGIICSETHKAFISGQSTGKKHGLEEQFATIDGLTDLIKTNASLALDSPTLFLVLFSPSAENRAEGVEEMNQLKRKIESLVQELAAKFEDIGVQTFYRATFPTSIQRRLTDGDNTTMNGTSSNTTITTNTTMETNTTSTNATDSSNTTTNVMVVLKSGGAPNGYSNDDPLTMQDVESFQLVLWTSVILIAVLFFSISMITSMEVPRDSLLYAKFLGESAHRKMD